MVFAFALAIVGCTATPLPEAPLEDQFRFLPPGGSLPFISIEGEIHPDHQLRIFELDTETPAQTLTPNDDGRVSGGLSATVTQVRLVVLYESVRSAPLDVSATTGATLSETACVSVARQLEVDAGVSAFVTIENGCDDALEVAMRTRLVGTPLMLPPSRTLAAGEAADFEILATSSTDEIVLIELAGAAEETRALTVFTR